MLLSSLHTVLHLILLLVLLLLSSPFQPFSWALGVSGGATCQLPSQGLCSVLFLARVPVCHHPLPSCYLKEHDPDSANGATKRSKPNVYAESETLRQPIYFSKWQSRVKFGPDVGMTGLLINLAPCFVMGTEVVPLEYSL